MHRNQIITFVLGLFFFINIQSTSAQIQENQLKKHVYYLASDKMKGRATGSKEVEKAAKYIEKYFKKYKLLPKGDSKYAQQFVAKVTRVKVQDSIRTAKNILGYLDNNAPYTIVIGAHYDHLGRGTEGGSRDSTGIGQIHNGADDNASGVAGLLELARHYSENNYKEPFNMLFIAFGAEELGLLGSKYFVENPTVSLGTIHWMLNMDMIGRYGPDNQLAVIGYGTSPQFENIFKGLDSDIVYFTSRDGSGGSDQTSFYRKDIPVLFFHTGGHADYHASGDDAHKINYRAMKSILNLAIKVIDRSMSEDKMVFESTN